MSQSIDYRAVDAKYNHDMQSATSRHKKVLSQGPDSQVTIGAIPHLGPGENHFVISSWEQILSPLCYSQALDGLISSNVPTHTGRVD